MDTKNNSKTIGFVILFFIIFLIAFTSFFIGVNLNESKETIVNFINNQIKISGNYGTEIEVGSIKKIALLNTLPTVNKKIIGFNNGNTLKGDFDLENFGTSKLYVYTGKPPYLYIYTIDDKVVIINYEDNKKTENLYKEMLELLNNTNK